MIDQMVGCSSSRQGRRLVMAESSRGINPASAMLQQGEASLATFFQKTGE